MSLQRCSRIGIILLSALVLASCGSMKTRSDSGSGVTDEEVDIPDESADPVRAETNAAPSSADRKYQPLAQAVRSGQAAKINEEAAKILSSNPNDPFALNSLALYHFKQGRPGAAKILLSRAFEKNQNIAALHNNLGIILVSEGDIGAATVSFKKALQIDARHVEAAGNLGAIYLRGGDANRALPLLEQAYRGAPTNTSFAVSYGAAQRAAGKLNEAQRTYESVLKKNPRDVAANLNLAILMIDYQNRPKDGLPLVYKVKFLETERKDVVERVNALEKKAKAALQ
ncbi:MAG TPA: tetratricopeptide repeat protein [Bdellovibrionales bacterium]|nr:tetratricopeptide repeat protein [Bdellovibrionales bacterium]